MARKYHPDKSASNQERATEEFKEIKHAYDIMIEATTEDEPPESRNAEQSATSASSAEDWRQPEQSATSASNAADWLLPDSMPPFEVAYKRQKWCDVNEDISREMYTAYLANIPGYYREPVTGNGKGASDGTRLTGTRCHKRTSRTGVSDQYVFVGSNRMNMAPF